MTLGKFVRHFLPVLKDMPAQYIYEPWTAPLAVQRRAKCILGKDYPLPIVDHAEASKRCRDVMGTAYAANRLAANAVQLEIAQLLLPLLHQGGLYQPPLDEWVVTELSRRWRRSRGIGPQIGREGQVPLERGKEAKES
ncbi:hypothetical protein CLOP_g22111 [Closterium sp. NIES-67]|nr:hypothetical protein CLOP_g22111 [Closterium sp. NIES-67]